MEQLYTVKEVAELLKVSDKTIRAWINIGKLSAFRVGQVWRIPQSAIQSVLEPIKETHERSECEAAGEEN